MDYSKYSNDYLLMLLKQSDSKAFEEIYNRYWKACFKYAIQKIADIPKVEDICHDVFLSIWQRRDSLDVFNLEAYLMQSVKYAVLRIKQADIKANLLSHQLIQKEETNETEYKVFFNEMNRAWQEGLEKLPESFKEVFICLGVAEMPYFSYALRTLMLLNRELYFSQILKLFYRFFNM